MMRNSVEFKVFGRYALFTDPISRVGGEKTTYHIPTYEALKGILSSVYWKPTFIWFIDKVRVMRPIKTQSRNAKPLKYSGEGKQRNDLAIYTYLADTEYQVQAHFDWNDKRDDLKGDRNDNKHLCVAKRMIERGGRRDVFLGTRECQGYVEPCTFGEGQGYYDASEGELSYGLTFHSYQYPDEFHDGELYALFWWPKMEGGVIRFPPPGDGLDRRFVRRLRAEPPITMGLDEPGLLEMCAGEEA